MSDDHKAKPRKRIDDSTFRRELFGERAGSAAVELEPQSFDENWHRSASGKDPAPSPRPATGYRNPPPETRFAKGMSGNPKGRPKGSGKIMEGSKGKQVSPSSSPTLDDIRRRHLKTPIRVRDGEGIREIHVIEALMRQVDKLAFAGGIQAARLALHWHQETMRAAEAEHQENMAWITDYCARYSEEAAAYERTGEPVPDHIPMPEDITCSREGGLRILGPYDLESLDNYLLLKRWRDAMHAKTIYDEIVFFSQPGVRITLTMAEFFVHHMDRLMPARWKLEGKEMQGREAVLLSASGSNLRTKLEKAFEPLGIRAPLRKPSPPVQDKFVRALGGNPVGLRKRFATIGSA